MDSKPTREETEKAAATWLLKRGDPQWSPADEREFEQWLAQAPGNRVSFVRLESIWVDADRLSSIASGLPKGVPPRGAIEQSPFFTLKQPAPDADDIFTEAMTPHPAKGGTARPWVREVMTRKRPVFAVAASILVIAGAGVVLQQGGIFAGDTYRTAIGGLSAIPAPDGTVVTLNTNSRAKIYFTRQERHVELEQGEAFFEVAQDPNRPFIVTAAGKRVVAVGTAFSVRLNPEGIRVIVTEGKVRLDTSASDTPRPLLAAGTVADIGKRRIHVEQKSVPEVEQSLSWRTGYIALDGTRLSEAVAEFNRYNTRQLALEDPSLASLKVEGNFRSNNLDGFVRLLEEGFEIEASESQGNRIALARKEK